ncbi:MAG: YegP family protein [Bacteroidales bacterium]|nr:YegP family protein [Bacteroidales bacterium]
MGKFVVKLRTNGDYQFDLKATNGQVILTSQGYKSKATCLNGIESVKKNCLVDARFERKTAKDGSPYFNLKATNGQVIGSSEMYSSVANMENGIASVVKNAPEAPIEDTTE